MRSELLAVLLLVGCAHDHFRVAKSGEPVRLCFTPELVVVDNEFPEEYYPALVRGFEYWNEALGKQVFFRADRAELDLESDDALGFIGVGILTTQETPAHGKERGATIIRYDGRGCLHAKVLFNPRSFDGDLERFETTVRHEFGHVLGLQHSADFTDLMYRAPSSEQTMQHPRDATDEEVKAVKRVYR